MTSRNARIALATAIASGALVLAACGGGGSSSSSSSAAESPIGGGSASCDQATLEGLAKGAAEASGATYDSTKSVQCEDGWAIVFANTTTNNVPQVSAYVFQAEGPAWALNQLDSICADGGGADVPPDIRDQACALR